MNTKLALLALLLACSVSGQTDTANIIGKPAPRFRLTDQNVGNGVSFSLDAWFSADSSHGVIVSFFATWCAPCRKELPYLQKMADSLSVSGLRLVAVCVDSAYGPKQKQMVTDLKLTCPVIHDKFGIVARRFGCGKALPFTVFINRNGMIAAVSTGYDASKNTELIHSISSILKEEQ